MKILVLAALIAAVTSGHLSDVFVAENRPQSPWQVGKLYRYEVESFTLARLPESASTGSAFKAHLLIRVTAPGRLLVRLEKPTHALVHQNLPEDRQLPNNLKYEPLENLEQPFEIAVEGGRIVTLIIPTSLPLAEENLLKGLIGALQLDLSTHHNVRKSYDGFEKETQQGSFKKMETDVTGDCETLYNIYPAVPEWRRELPQFAGEEEPIMVSKTKNYGHCHHRVAYHFGIPRGSVWTGTAHNKEDEQFIHRATASRILVGKQGPIYKSETTSTVHVTAQLYGKDKAEVISYVKLYLLAFEQDTAAEWVVQKPEETRLLNNLLYSMSQKKQIMTRESSSSLESSESIEVTKTIDGEEVTNANRVRRSAKTPKIVAINKIIVKRSDEHSTSSSSSSSDSSSTFENDDFPSELEPLSVDLYMIPQDRPDKKQNPQSVQRLLQDLAQQLQNPNNMPKSDFLAKFNILVSVLASMNFEQLSLTSRALEVTKSSNNLIKADMWMIYRDAMAQVGNMPTFKQIKTWILNKKIQEEEAAEVVASLVHTIRYPTKEMMLQFFNLAISDEVREQPYLNSTALIASTRLINMGQVDNTTAHSFYPTHMYGRLCRRHDLFVIEEVIPYLSQTLKEAIERGDSSTALVYIKAIGNLGHRNILDIFTPYLEGKIRVSTYLRVHMVQNLRVLAHERDYHVRAVLFSILKNIAEPYEVRVAAIENIFMARPNSAMMQAMAQMTHNDPSVQIRAILKSSILTAADLKHPRNMDLARTAQSAKWMVTKQEYGKQYSNKYLNDYDDRDHDLGFMTALSYTGSEDSFWPKSLKYSIKSKVTGWDKESTISASVSDFHQLMNTFQRAIDRMARKQPKSESEHKYSAEKISEILNIKHNPKKPLEASILVDLMGQERFFSYSESELEQMPMMIAKYMAYLAKGAEKHYTKVVNQAQVSVMFPLCTGMPFIYKYKEPTVIHTYGKIKGEINPSVKENEDMANIVKEIFFTFAKSTVGNVGFMDTLAQQYASVGVDSKVQIHLPLKLQLQAKSGELKITVDSLRPDQDTNVLHYSVWPYSTCQKRDSLMTVAQDTNTKVVDRSKKVVSVDSRFGQTIGNIFQIQGYSYSNDYNNIGSLFSSQDLLMNIIHLLRQRDVALTHFNLRHLGKQSRNKRVVLNVAYDLYYNPTVEATKEQSLVANHMNDVTPNSKERRQQMVTGVCAGIKTARARVIDVSTSFEGQQKIHYVMTLAVGDSPVDEKIQYAFFAGKSSDQAEKSADQINAVGTVVRPVTSSLNFLETIKKDMKVKFDFDIKYGQSGNGNVKIDGFMERSKEYTEELLKHQLAKQCMQQIEDDNLYQHACHKMLVKAHTPDYLRTSVVYKEVSPVFRNMTYKAFRFFDNLGFGFWYTDVNPMKTTPDGKLEIVSQWWYPDNTMSLALSTRLGEVHFNNVPMPRNAGSLLAVYPPFKPAECVVNEFTRDQYQPYCTVDLNKIRTFSNRTYEYSLTRSWHVVMQHNDMQQGGNDKLVVLARRQQQKNLDLYISYKTQNGRDLEVEVQPNTQEPNAKHIVKVNTNAKKVINEDLVMYMDEFSHDILLEYYTLPDGVLIINVLENHLRLMYDGSRLVVLANEHRNMYNGLCGRMSGDARDDYLTPTGIVDRPEHYGASFALKAKFSLNTSNFHYTSSEESLNESNDDNDAKESSGSDVPKSKKVKNKKYKRITDSAKKNTSSKELKELSKDSLIDLKDNSLLQGEKPSKRRLKLLSMWAGPKKHRMASLNAMAKVHCLYENESRTHMELGLMKTIDRQILPSTSKTIQTKKRETKTNTEKSPSASESEYENKTEKKDESSESSDDSPPLRSLRGVPGIRSAGKYWDPKSSTSSSEDSELETKKKTNTDKKKTNVKTSTPKSDTEKPPTKMKKTAGVPVKKKRNRNEVVMDLKDMVVQKRMASLNATAILAASYEKRSPKSSKDDTTSDSCSDESFSQKPKNGANSGVKSETKLEDTKTEADEATSTDRKQKVEVIVNQDTDVTITGVYSTHHEGFCTAMQYRISSTSHTQTTATANCEKEGCSREDGARYTPLSALSSMQPPAEHAHNHPHPVPELGGLARRAAGCSSAFSAPSPAAHHEPGYYQPAGPLIKETGAEAERALARYHPQPHYHAPHPSVLQQYGAPYYPADLCYGRYYRPSGAYHMPPPQPDAQMVGVGSEPYPPPQYYGTPPCYQHSPQRIPYVEYRCPCPLNACPKNVLIGPATGKAPTGGGPADVPSALAPPGGAFRAKVRACALDAVADTHGSGKDPPLESEPPAASDAPHPCPLPAIGGASPKRELYDVRENLRLAGDIPGPAEPIGPPSPARGSAGVCAPQPPSAAPRRARLGKAMARRSLAGDDTGLLLSVPQPPMTQHSDADDDVLAISPPVCAPIDLSSSDERSTPLVDVKKENEGPTNALSRKTDAQALREHNCTTVTEQTDVIDTTKAVKRRYSRPKLEIDMKDTQLEDGCKTNGIGEHVKLQKRRKVSGDQTDIRLETVVKEVKKRASPVKKAPKTTSNEKKTAKRKLESNTGGPKPKKSLIESIAIEDPRLKNVAAVTEEPLTAKPKTKSALLLDNLIRKNSIDRLDSKGYAPDSKLNPAELFLGPDENVTQSCSKRTLNINNNVVDNVGAPTPVNGVQPNTIAAVTQLIGKKLASKNACKVDKVDSKITHNIKSVLKTPIPKLEDDLKCTKKSETLVEKAGAALADRKERDATEDSKEGAKEKCEKTGDREKPKAQPQNKTETVESQKPEDVETENKASEAKVKRSKLANGDVKAKNVEKVVKLLVSKRPAIKADEATTVVEEACSAVGGGGARRSRRRRSGGGPRRARRPPAPLAPPAHEPRAPPRWSNGWNFDGDHYLSKVYLSNDSRLDRTARCWARMRHASGDSVARGDCVLLRASVARAQPYVARVASLWQNPDDGEMMVSLVWYYRPEHTERGRQAADAPDEVFASRHRDANSVACIEDKCYVLTFNEYCRYRKRLKAAEEGITIAPSIVPPLPAPAAGEGGAGGAGSAGGAAFAPNDSKLPPSVSPELVLFCRKIYDFRSKKIHVPNK